MLLQTNSYIVPRDKRAEHARLLRRFRQMLAKLGCDDFEAYEQVGANWSTGEPTGRYVQIMRFRDRRHQVAVQGAERSDPAAQALIAEFCALINFPYQQQQGLFAVGFYNSVLPVGPARTTAPEDPGGHPSHATPAASFVAPTETAAEAAPEGLAAGLAGGDAGPNLPGLQQADEARPEAIGPEAAAPEAAAPEAPAPEPAGPEAPRWAEDATTPQVNGAEVGGEFAAQDDAASVGAGAAGDSVPSEHVALGEEPAGEEPAGNREPNLHWEDATAAPEGAEAAWAQEPGDDESFPEKQRPSAARNGEHALVEPSHEAMEASDGAAAPAHAAAGTGRSGNGDVFADDEDLLSEELPPDTREHASAEEDLADEDFGEITLADLLQPDEPDESAAGPGAAGGLSPEEPDELDSDRNARGHNPVSR